MIIISTTNFGNTPVRTHTHKLSFSRIFADIPKQKTQPRASRVSQHHSHFHARAFPQQPNKRFIVVVCEATANRRERLADILKTYVYAYRLRARTARTQNVSLPGIWRRRTASTKRTPPPHTPAQALRAHTRQRAHGRWRASRQSVPITFRDHIAPGSRASRAYDATLGGIHIHRIYRAYVYICASIARARCCTCANECVCVCACALCFLCAA